MANNEIEPREEVKSFAQVMEQKLKENDYKGGWKDCTFEYLFTRLIEEVAEVSRERRIDSSPHTMARSCADIANFAMMIADNYGEL